jgi:hypothetical protein
LKRTEKSCLRLRKSWAVNTATRIAARNELTPFGLAMAAFFVSLRHAIGFWRRHQIAFLAGRLFSEPPQDPGCGAACSDAIRVIFDFDTLGD